MYTKLQKYMQSYVKVNSVELGVIKMTSEVIRLRKGEILQRMGDQADALYFVASGILRGYTIDENGKDYTWSIFFNDPKAKTVNIFAVDYESFLNKTPSRLEIEVLEDCELIRFSSKQIEMLYNYSKKFQAFGRMMAENAYCHLHNVVIDRQIKSAQQRFEEFMQNTPHLLEKVPQYHIASFLDITPQHLSRLKKLTYVNE